MDTELVDYYRRRAREYEAIYARPERQADLEKLRSMIGGRFEGERVLEIACGTGYWTGIIASAAKEVLATDLADEPMAIARAKSYRRANVRFEPADAYALAESLGRHGAAFAGFWWSHVPRQRIAEFLGSLHARLEPGARVVLLDNLYVQGSSTPVAGMDAAGNTYQMRRLGDGSRVRVLKNFVAEEELRERLAPHASAFSYEALEYYWVAEYQLKQ
ncbi:MAG TPA: class I SAM-dependent methyltransferase [Burkholderiales bacterium]|jgi:demethylmenaquinone methyltransferase/2-methoxy-6-polyprenyl-1,4-benzoquinol methylase